MQRNPPPWALKNGIARSLPSFPTMSTPFGRYVAAVCHTVGSGAALGIEMPRSTVTGTSARSDSTRCGPSVPAACRWVPSTGPLHRCRVAGSHNRTRLGFGKTAASSSQLAVRLRALFDPPRRRTSQPRLANAS